MCAVWGLALSGVNWTLRLFSCGNLLKVFITNRTARKITALGSYSGPHVYSEIILNIHAKSLILHAQNMKSIKNFA